MGDQQAKENRADHVDALDLTMQNHGHGHLHDNGQNDQRQRQQHGKRTSPSFIIRST